MISTRALNRATLARQLLLERSDLGVVDAVEHLVGLQAQTPHTWYVGLWSRLRDLTPKQVSDALESRELVRIALMRSTIHLVSAADCLRLRPLLAAMLTTGTNAIFGKRLVGVDREELVAAGRSILEEQAMTFGELGKTLASKWPDHDPLALAQAVRGDTPLVQVTPRGLWGRSGKAAHTTAEQWLGDLEVSELTLAGMVRRYLGAFGPASVKDVQTWSGLTRLSEVVEEMDLVTFTDEHGRELFDVPDAPRPDEDTPAPVRFLYDFDNLLLSHADRSRVVTPRVKEQNFDPHGPIPRLVLVDGVTAGAWTTEIGKERAVLKVRPFDPWPAAARDEAEEEGARLLAFLAGEISDQRVEVG
ncbi:Winged helix DNA-binding domain-containing protein [Actinokineospora alba]|uniref:Winged helix DNA-binding domain-containing protein n=1 Tax=Actinokineospora alba TaxID=504798 RepID=A0A1H0QNB9_9PSEU|nr:winged helix DNA-binding domain-containing protein [Actinokineospora alba]TDP70495.1 winged helix DNA-binding protein [Actinokineospora alba]SDI30054.1 Winged helix DNA-binding domain-containing protein [Actinokineospora alba]SDP18168.1 Winged helix DNA-binding domain-containing protein [Actinokineospora alba]